MRIQTMEQPKLIQNFKIETTTIPDVIRIIVGNPDIHMENFLDFIGNFSVDKNFFLLTVKAAIAPCNFSVKINPCRQFEEVINYLDDLSKSESEIKELGLFVEKNVFTDSDTCPKCGSGNLFHHEKHNNITCGNCNQIIIRPYQ